MSEPMTRPLGQYEPHPEPTAGRDVIRRQWPADGPHSAASVARAADALAELVRYCNHATRSPDTLGSAPALCTTPGGLHDAADGIGQQLARQLAHTAEEYAADADLRHDQRGESAQAAAAEAAVALRAAAVDAASLAGSIDRAHQHLAHLYHQ